MISKIGRKPDLITKSNTQKWISLDSYDGIGERVVTSKFNQQHHMYKTYGITDMEVHRFDDGRDYIKIDGDIFEGAKSKKFSFYASKYTKKTENSVTKQVETFLKDLKEVRKMNISDNMIRVIKCIH